VLVARSITSISQDFRTIVKSDEFEWRERRLWGKVNAGTGLSSMEGEISIEEILCPHGRLDPGKTADMKRIDRVRPHLLSYILLILQDHTGYVRSVHTGIWCIIRSNTGADRYLP
jgi:hypothetical protein